VHHNESFVANNLTNSSAIANRGMRFKHPFYSVGRHSVTETFDYVVFSTEEPKVPVLIVPGVVAGPTCDSIDYLGSRTGVPLLSIGDVIVIKEIGAYSVATACHFNGIKPPMIIDLDEGHELSRMLA